MHSFGINKISLFDIVFQQLHNLLLHIQIWQTPLPFSQQLLPPSCITHVRKILRNILFCFSKSFYNSPWIVFSLSPNIFSPQPSPASSHCCLPSLDWKWSCLCSEIFFLHYPSSLTVSTIPLQTVLYFQALSLFFHHALLPFFVEIYKEEFSWHGNSSVPKQMCLLYLRLQEFQHF